MRGLLSVVVFVCAFAVNPAYVMGCGTGRTFNFSEQEMLSVSERMTGRYPFSVGSTKYVVALELRPQRRAARAGGSLFAASAFACETRSIFPTASACVDSSEIQVAGTMMLERISADGTRAGLESPLAIEGHYSVAGSRLNNGYVELRGEDVQVLLDSDGKSFSLRRFELSDVGEVISFDGDD